MYISLPNLPVSVYVPSPPPPPPPPPRAKLNSTPMEGLSLYATATKQILNLSSLLKGSDIKRTSRRTALLKGRNTLTIELPLMHLKGIGIGMTPLSDWLNVLPRGSGIAGVTELHYHPKVCHGMLYCMSSVAF